MGALSLGSLAGRISSDWNNSALSLRLEASANNWWVSKWSPNNGEKYMQTNNWEAIIYDSCLKITNPFEQKGNIVVFIRAQAMPGRITPGINMAHTLFQVYCVFAQYKLVISWDFTNQRELDLDNSWVETLQRNLRVHQKVVVYYQ